MQEVGLDAAHEAFRTGTAGVQIDRHLETFLEEEFETHEARQGGGGAEFHEEIQVIGIGFTPRRRAKEPKFRNPGVPQVTLQQLHGVNDGLKGGHVFSFVGRVDTGGEFFNREPDFAEATTDR